MYRKTARKMKEEPGGTVRLSIFNPAGYGAVDERRMRRLVRHVLASEEAPLKEVHIIIVDDGYMTGLNSEFLSKHGSTNVIAFDLGDVSEIYVSCDQVREADDLYYFVVHGLLHLAGHEHEGTRAEKNMHDTCMKYLEQGRADRPGRKHTSDRKRGRE